MTTTPIHEQKYQADDLASHSRKDLRDIARTCGITGFSKMNREQLQKAILAWQGDGDGRPRKGRVHQVLNGTPGLIAWFDDFGGDHEHAFLSNFYEGERVVLDFTWGQMAKAYGWPDEALEREQIDPDWLVEGATGEHLFAAFKTDRLWDFLEVLEATSPGASKSKGRAVKLRPDWEQIKYDVMAMVLRAKFTLDRDEGQWLLNTGDALLIEGTFWQDRVWGVDLKNRASDPLTSPGRNWLGTLLMARRAELYAEQAFGIAAPTSASNARFVLWG